MQIIAPVTDYIPASILTTPGDIVIRGAAGPERLAEIDWRGVHIDNELRNAGGNQVIAGVGFESSVVMFIARDDNGMDMNYSWGFDNGTLHCCIAQVGDAGASVTENTMSIKIDRGGGNSITGVITAIGANGFTIFWTLSGNCVANFIYLCRP